MPDELGRADQECRGGEGGCRSIPAEGISAEECCVERKGEAGTQSGGSDVADGGFSTGDQPCGGFVCQSDQQASEWRVIRQVCGSFEDVVSDGGCEEQRAMLFEGLCELDSLEDIERFVDGHSGPVGQW